MKYYTFVLSKDEATKLNEIYEEFKVPNSNEHVSFQAKRNNVDLLMYNSNKLVLRGTILKNEIAFIKNILERLDFDAIGSDEVGTGDVFGPVTVCAAYVSLDDIEFLESLNIRDSKSVNDKFIIENAPKIAKRITHSLIILDPIKYNQLVDEGYNLNKIKAHLHNQAIISLHSKLKNKNVPIIVDQFCSPQQYYNYLKDELLVNRDIEFHTKAEDYHVSVAAAAVIARYAFLYSMQKLNNKVGIKLAKGASKTVDDQLVTLVEKHGKKILYNVSKTNFKNVTKLIDQ